MALWIEKTEGANTSFYVAEQKGLLLAQWGRSDLR